MSSASERANGPALMSGFLVILGHSALNPNNVKIHFKESLPVYCVLDRRTNANSVTENRCLGTNGRTDGRGNGWIGECMS